MFAKLGNMIITTILLVLAIGGAKSETLEIVNEWNLLSFDFPYDANFVNMFRPENTVLTGLEIGHDRVFLAMPRLREGVPATLATIPRNTPPGSSPNLQAYPSWAYHTAGVGDLNCTGLISVYRIRQDSCGRLWVLDSGVMTSIDDFRPVCPPKLVIFDMRTNVPVRTIQFPREVLRPASLLTNLIVDETLQGRCDNALIYMTDTAAPGIVVYDGRKDSAWRFIHPTMFPDPDFNEYNIQGETFSLMDGIIGLAHSPKLGLIYFQPLATDRLYSVSTTVLRNGPLPEFQELPVQLVGKKSSQGVGLAVDPRDDTLYFSPVTETAVAAWQPGTNGQRTIAYDPERLQFAAELRYAERDNGNVWVLTTRFQRFFKRQANPSEVNLRILKIVKQRQIAPNPQVPHSYLFGFGGNSIYLKK